MAKEQDYTCQSSGGEAQLQYSSIEQFNRDQAQKQWPSIILAAVIVLFVSSGGGVALAVVLMLNPLEVQGVCLSRDLILFAACLSILYTGLHCRAAIKDTTRENTAPPQIYGDYLHATALFLARLSIGVWIVALVATAIMISRAIPFEGLAAKLPIINLVICTGAM